MNVLVYEPKSVGHFLGFALKSAEAFAGLGASVTLAVPRHAEGGEQAVVKLADPPANITVDYCLDSARGYQQWQNGRIEAERLGELLAERQPDHLVVPSGDFLLCGLLARPRVRRRVAACSGDVILHNCTTAYPRIGIRNRACRVWDQVAVTMAPRSLALHTVDPFVLSREAGGRIAFGRRPIGWLPHFFDYAPTSIDPETAREELGLPRGKRLIGSIGDLGTRKGTELLIRSFARSGPPTDAVLVLFGKLSSSAKAVLVEQPQLVKKGRVVVYDRFVSDHEFRLFFSAIDAFWAGFPHQIGFSSTLLHAAVAGRLVVGSDYGFVGWFIRQYGLGRACPASVEPMAEAISWALQEEPHRPEPAGVGSILSQYGTERFAQALTTGFRRQGSVVDPVLAAPKKAAGARG